MSRRLAVVSVVISGWLGLTPASFGGVSVYDFSTGAGVDRFAYGVSVPAGTIPPMINTVPLTGLTTADYSAMAVSDEVRYTTGVVETGDYAATRFVFTIAEPTAAINQLDVLWEGSADQDPPQALWLWNATSASYIQVGSQAVRIPLDGVVSGTYTTNVSEFVAADNTITLLAIFNDIDGALFTDYVSVTVTTTSCGMDSDCDDGIFCNGVEVCVNGFCQPGPPVNCDDGNACTDDVCNEVTDSCDHVATVCDDGLFCNGVETCDPVLGCLPGTPIVCDDGIPCTVDTCSEFSGICVHTPDHAACDNGIFCDGVEVCDPVLGCQPGPPVDCNDNIACTIDSCNEAAGACDHVPDGPECNITNIRYVDPAATGANDGTSWADAYTELRDVLPFVEAGNEIWVVAGTFTPAPPAGPASASFQIPSGVAVYGGFVGGETSLNQRDPAVNVTILSGDLANDDTLQFINLPNAYHVVTMDVVDASTRLDGFEIRNGYTFFGPANEQTGGGLRISNGDPTIANCEFTRCFAERGGGISASISNATIENCLFNGNWSSDWVSEGGALSVETAGVVTVRDSSFWGNKAEGTGGWSHGGAIYSGTGTTITIERCDFSGNTALNRSGGGISWCRGGAVYCQGDTFINQSTFNGNVSNVGGAVQSSSAPPITTRILNCLFNNNDAISVFISGQERAGAAGTIAGGDEIEFIGSVVHGGFSDNYGGAVVGPGAKVSGSIFWNNTDNNGSIGNSNIRTLGLVEYSCVQGMLIPEPGENPPDPMNFPGSTSADPLFVNPISGDFHLQAGSPCIDAADNTAWPPGVTMDLDGNPRFFDDPSTLDTGIGPPPVVDMGPYEFASAFPIGDINCDGMVDMNDSPTMVGVLLGIDTDPCHATAADMNGDTSANGDDIQLFVQALIAP